MGPKNTHRPARTPGSSPAGSIHPWHSSIRSPFVKAWIYQDPKQIQKLGEAKAAWYVGWRSPDGKRHCQSCGPGSLGKLAAKKKSEKLHVDLSAGTYQS